MRRLVLACSIAALVGCDVGGALEIGETEQGSVCGEASWELVHDVRDHTGPLGDLVRSRADLVGQLRWDDLEGYPELENIDPATGRAMCTVTQIDAHHVITAGHCFIRRGSWPRRDGRALGVSEAASYMVIRFGYEDATGLDAVETFAVEGFEMFGDLADYDYFATDYAVLRLAEPRPMEREDTPGFSFGAVDNAQLAIMQHPSGDVKKVATGSLSFEDREVFEYAIDTDNGSSGAAIMDFFGNIVGLHVRGGCDEPGGSNSGVTAYSVGVLSPALACAEARNWAYQNGDVRGSTIHGLTADEVFAQYARDNLAPKFVRWGNRSAGIRRWVPCEEIAERLMVATIDDYADESPSPDPSPPPTDEVSTVRCQEIREWVRVNEPDWFGAYDFDYYVARNWAPYFRDRNDWSAGFYAWADCEDVLLYLQEIQVRTNIESDEMAL